MRIQPPDENENVDQQQAENDVQLVIQQRGVDQENAGVVNGEEPNG